MPEMRHSLRRRLLFASATLAILVGAAYVVLIVTLFDVRSQQRARGHSEKVIAKANNLEQLVLDLDTDARRYAVTRNGSYLGALRIASQKMRSASEQLVGLS